MPETRSIPNQQDGIVLARYSYRDNKLNAPKDYLKIEDFYKVNNKPFPFSKDWNEQFEGKQLQNRFDVLVNRDKRHIVVTIEGSVVLDNWTSDIFDAGAREFKKLEPQLDAAIVQLKKDWPDYNIVASGHSLGGGMAQSIGLKHGLDVQTLNSLSISRTLFADGTFKEEDLKRYVAQGHRADAMSTSMNIATFNYDRTLNGVFLWREVNEPATFLPGTDMPSPVRWAMAPVMIPVMAVDHMGGAATNASIGLSLDPQTGKFILPEGPMAFGAIPVPVRDQFAYLSPSPGVEVRQEFWLQRA